MSKETKEIQALAKWCQKARAIVGVGFKGKSKLMEDQIDSVERMLKSLSSKTEDTDKELFAVNMERFRELSSQHETLWLEYQEAVNAKDKIKKDGPEREKAKLLVEQKRQAIKGLIAGMGKLKDDMLADAPLAKAVHFFELSVRNAENQINDELSRDLSNKGELQGALRLLQQWKSEVQTLPLYQAPAEVEKLTSQIKPLLTRIIKTNIKESGAKRELEEKQSLARGAAEQQHKEVSALLKELRETGQLVPSIGTQLQKAIDDSQNLFTQEKWIEGAALLKPLPKRKQCLKAFESARLESLIDLAPEIEQAGIGLAGLEGHADVATLQRHTTALKLLQGRAGDPQRTIKDNAALLKDFKALIQQLKDELRYAIVTAGTLTTLVGELRTTKLSLDAVSPINRAEENGRQLELIEVLRNERRWKEALDTATLLKSTMERQINPAFEEWRRVGSVRGRKPTMDALGMAVANPAMTPALKQGALDLLSKLAPSQVLRLEEARDWTTLVALHKEAAAFANGLSGQLQKFKDFAGARKDADGVIQLRLTRCASELESLQGALTTAGVDAAPVLKPLQDRLAELKKDWQQRMASATEASDLNQPQFEQDLNLLQQSILSSGVGGNMDEVLQQQRDAKGQAAFNGLLQTLEKNGLANLDPLSSAKAEAFRLEITKLAADSQRETEPAAPWAQRLAALDAIGFKVTTAIGEAEQECTRLNTELSGKADAIELTLKAAKQELASKGLWGSLAARYEPMFDDLTEELAGLRQLLSTSNVSAATGNRALLADLKTRADKIVLLAMNNKGLDGREGRVERVGVRLEGLRKDGLTKLAAETDKALGEQLAGLKRDMFGMEPDVMNQALDEIGRALDAAAVEMQGLLAQQKKLSDLNINLRPRIATLRQKGAAVPYYDKLLERVGAAIEQGKAVDKLSAAVLAMEAIATEVQQCEANPEAALSRQKLQMTEEHAAARLKKEYQGRLDPIKTRVLPRARQAVVDASGDMGQVDEVDRMVTMAEKAAKEGDYERAIQVLVRVENRVAEIERNPAGTALGDRKALPKHVETFAAQMSLLRDELGRFVDAAVALAPESAKEAVRKPLEAAVLNAKSQLNPRVFDLYIGPIVDGEMPMAERRALRDQALQRLRELRTFITGHPTMVKLALNPIQPLTGALRSVDSSLTRLEAHLRTAVR